MDYLAKFYEALPSSVVTLAIIAATVLVLWAANWFLLRRNRHLDEKQTLPRVIAMVLLVVLGCVIILLGAPIGDATRTQLIGLLGILLSVIIALSSTTFVANAMAGGMLRAVRSFRTGDFIQVGEQFGRVTERGLFHIEIQTEDRDLTTLPNLYLITNPVKVVRYSGTVVSATVSLGYDVPHKQVMSLLTEAASQVELQDPFVQVMELGDFSVTYRIAGFLTEVKQLLTVRSNLRAQVLTSLHGSGIEIVSPNFMTQRRLREDERVLPCDVATPVTTDVVQVPEELIFDKADQAEEFERLHMEQGELETKIADLERQRKSADPNKRSDLDLELARLRQRYDAIAEALESAAQKEAETK